MDKVKIYAFTDENFTEPEEGSEGDPAFTVPINPESFTKNLKIPA